MLKRSFGIAMAFIGVLAGASFASGREALQYFVAFGNMGIVGAVVTALAMMISGITILQLGSYHRAKEHTTVFDAVSTPIVSKLLDISTLICLFCIGFAMFAGAGTNLNQQWGWPVWIGAGLMLVLTLLTGLLDVDKVTIAIGAITPFIIVLLTIGTLYTVFTASPDWATLNQQAQDIPTTLPNWWVSAINNVGLNVIVVVSMTIVIGGNFLDTREVGLGGVMGGLCFLFLLAVLVGGLYISIGPVTEAEMPTLEMISQIHPILGMLMAIAIYGMIYNTAIGMFYAFAKRLTRKKPENFYKVYVISVLIGFVLSFIGFSNLVDWVYPFLGYMGIAIMFIIAFAWIKNRKKLESESELRRRARELLRKRFEDKDSLTEEETRELVAIARNSSIPESSFITEIMAEVDTDDPDAQVQIGKFHALITGKQATTPKGSRAAKNRATPTGSQE
ncbi:YkvI family membrane protein [Corynebacterium camporealensis]